MRADYRRWLEEQKYAANTVVAQLHRASRVEEHHGDLDEHYANDHMAGLIDTLRYTTDDARHNRPNPSRIPFDGDIRNNLASYRSAVERYRRFRENSDNVGDAAVVSATEAVSPPQEDLGQRVGLERDMQAALRGSITQLEPDLVIIDDGAERSVESGFIDITARDAGGITVIIELKAGSAGQRAVAQILSYMGDVVAEEDGARVRGILVASDFDSKAKAAARVVPHLKLVRYGIRFSFSDGHK
jgi:hypothetical protein